MQLKPSVRQAEMGVTIHFEGRLHDQEAFARAMEAARSFADQNGWHHVPLAKEMATLTRTRGEEDWDYVGPTSGVTISPHDDCDPLHLEFDRDLYVQEFVKTQFAPPIVHMRIIELLRRIAPEFDDLQVDDEAEYWPTSEEALLEAHRQAFVQAFEEALKENPRLAGPFRLPDGRMVDLMEQE